MRTLALIAAVLLLATGTTSIVCPVGAVSVAPGDDLPAMVAFAAEGAAFCLKAGTYALKSSVNPKTSQSFTGENGAIVDGSNVAPASDAGSTSIFRGWNCSRCSDVTIRNLVIKGLSTGNCIGAVNGADRWTIDHNEIAGCNYGVNVGWVDSVKVTSNLIHDNSGNPAYSGGYGANVTTNLLFENNEFAYNGRTQKVTGTTGTIFRGNYSHRDPNAIWIDGDNVNVTIENNTIEDAPEVGIFYEISGTGVIRNNTVRRSGDSGIFVSTSRDLDISGNVLEDNYRGMNFFVACDRVYPAGQPYADAIGWDLRNNAAHDNRISTGTVPGALASSIGYTACTDSQIAPYLNGSKGLTFDRNAYTVPVPTGLYWWFGALSKSFQQWQAIPQDSAGTLNAVSVPPPVPDPTPSDTTPPSVTLNAPSTVARKSSVSLTASASDDTGVVKVEFYRDSTLLCSDTAEPFVCQWNAPAAPNKSYRFTAKAYDGSGNVGTSNTVTVSVR